MTRPAGRLYSASFRPGPGVRPGVHAPGPSLSGNARRAGPVVPPRPGWTGGFSEQLEFIDGFTARLESENRPAFLYGGIGAIAGGALMAFWPSAPVDVSPDIRNNGLRVSKTFGW